MILKIDFRPEDVIFQGKGRILLKLNYYASFSNGCHLATTEGTTQKEFDKNKAKASKTVFVGQKGGLSLG